MDVLPEEEGWIRNGSRAGYPQGIAEVQDGVLRLQSTNGGSLVYNCALPSSLTAITYEIQFKVVSGSKNGCQLLYLGYGGGALASYNFAINGYTNGVFDHWVAEGYYPGDGRMTTGDLTDTMHSLWLTANSDFSYSVWLDSDYIGNFANTRLNAAADAFLYFGVGFQSDSEIYIDLVRLSTDGAFAPNSVGVTATPTNTGASPTQTPSPTETSSPTETPTLTETPDPELALESVSPDERQPLSQGEHRFAFEFGYLMDQEVDLLVEYGRAPPYAFGRMEVSDGWVTDFVWTGKLRVTDDTEDGSYTLRVSEARTASGILLADDTNHRFLVEKVNTDELTDGTVTARSTNALALEWELSGNPGVVQHQLVRSTADVGPFTVAANLPASGSEFVDTGLTEETNYFYKVFEFNPNAKGIGNGNRELTRVFGDSTLKSIINGDAEAIGQTRMKLTWDDVPDPRTHVLTIQRGEVLNDQEFANVGVVHKTALTFTDTALRPNTLYHYRLNRTAPGGGNIDVFENPFSEWTRPYHFVGGDRVESDDVLWALKSMKGGMNDNIFLFDYSRMWPSLQPAD